MFSPVKLMIICSSCRNEINQPIKQYLSNLNHKEYKTKGREIKTWKDYLLFRPSDEDKEVFPQLLTYLKWLLRGKPNCLYDIIPLYDGKELDLVTYGGVKMFRAESQILWERQFDKQQHDNLMITYRKFNTTSTTSYVPSSGYHASDFGDREPRMYGNARSSDPAACYRSDIRLEECIGQIRRMLNDTSTSSQRYIRAYICPTLTNPHNISRLEAEILIKWVKTGKYEGEFTPTINALH